MKIVGVQWTLVIRSSILHYDITLGSELKLENHNKINI